MCAFKLTIIRLSNPRGGGLYHNNSSLSIKTTSQISENQQQKWLPSVYPPAAYANVYVTRHTILTFPQYVSFHIACFWYLEVEGMVLELLARWLPSQ